MTSGTSRRKKLQRGTVDVLASGAIRVRVDAGIDPITKKRHRLVETIPAGTPDAAAVAENTRVRLITEVNERRNPRTSATVGQLLDRYLRQFDGSAKTRIQYRAYVKNHIAPFLGKAKVADLDADVLDSFYAELRRCRDHCTGPFLQHRTSQPHECDHRCGPHRCRPLGASAVRHIHFVLSGAYKRAVRWRWVSVSPLSQAEPPAAPPPKPQPPSAVEAAKIVTDAWRDPDWGTFIWLAMTTGARRGELCALRWSDVDLHPERAVIWLRRAISRDETGWVETDTKTHQQRRLALDLETVEVLTAHRERWSARVGELGLQLDKDAFVFSSAPDASSFCAPDSMTRRYERQVHRLGIDTTLHKLRHYSATELIAAGVDVRTVAGRLGHAGGGTTTLRTYTAWVSEADQRAAQSVSGRMPSRPVGPGLTAEQRAQVDPQSPFEKVAVHVRQRIVSGELPTGAPAPTVKEIAAEHAVSVGTAHRAVALLKAWGLVDASRGRRAIVTAPAVSVEEVPVPSTAQSDLREPLDLEVLHLGEVVRKFRTEADPNSTVELRQLLVDAVRRQGGTEAELGEYEMNVRYAGERGLITTFVASARG